MEEQPNLAEIKREPLSLTGDGIRLRLLAAEDLSTILNWRNRDDIRGHFIHSNIIAWEHHFAWWEQYCSRDNDFVFIIEETRYLNRAVGQIALYKIDLKKGEAEYGRLMIGDSEARGKGLAWRATELVLSWAFIELGLKRLYLEVFMNNAIALALYRRTGFTICREEGNLYIMSIRRDDWSRRCEQ